MDTQSELYHKAHELFSSGKVSEAKSIIVQIKNPQAPEILLLAAQIFLSSQDYSMAEEKLLKLYEMESNNLDIGLALALCYKKNSKVENSFEIYQMLVVKHPSSYEVFYNMGILLYDVGEYSKSVEAFDRAIELNPELYNAYYNKGNALRQLKKYNDAEIAFTETVKIYPSYSDAWYNRGVVKETQLKFAEALVDYEKAIECDSENVEAHWNRAIMLLLLGNAKEGWKEYEWRLKKPEFIRNDLYGKKWNGEDLKNKKIYVYSEQGIGDLLQMLRYLKLLKEKGAYIILECKKFLFNLFNEQKYIDKLASKDELRPDYDFYIPMFSLPGSFLSNEKTKSYLNCNNELNKKWQKYFSDFNEYKVGIVWQGNKNHKDDKYRSATIEQFSCLLKAKNVKIFSLQKLDETEIEEHELKKMGIVSLDNNFENTAAIINNLDHVITVDTSIAHLAGGLGKKVWTLLSAKPDWRWGLTDSYTEWYPSMKLFRQNQLGNYDEVFERITIELNKTANAESGSFSAYYEKGLMAFGDGNLAEAIYLIEKAVAINAKDASVLSNLGLIYQRNEQFDLAQKYYEAAINTDIYYTKAYSNLAILFTMHNNYNEAKRIMKQAADIDPLDPEIHYNLGLIHFTESENEEAVKCFYKAVELNPSYKEVYYNLALTLLKSEYISEAEDVVVKAENNNVQTAELFFVKGNILKAKERYENAIECYIQSTQLNNTNIDAYINLGSALFLSGKFDDAIILYGEMIACGINDTRIYYSLAVIKHELNFLDEAIDLFRKAIDIQPDNYESHLGLAEVYLTLGNYNKGFDEYEWRLRRPEYKERIIRLPESLTEIDEKRIYVFSEQGFGDIINFSHYLNELKKHGAEVTFETRPELADLMRNNFEVETVVSNMLDESFDYAVPLLSLPKLFLGLTGELKFPSEFFKLGSVELQKWASEINSSDKIKIGIFWKGKSFPVHNRKRHAELANFSFLSEFSNVEVYSLQFEHDVNLSDYSWVKTRNKKIENFSDTASIINCMDLVITIDSAVAHLAGAMGKETWLLLAHIPDWRWHLKIDHTQWYKTVKLFRQKERGDWQTVFQNIKTELKEKLAANG